MRRLDRPVTFPVRPEAFPPVADPEHPELVRPVASERQVVRQRVVPAPDSSARPRLAAGLAVAEVLVDQAFVAAVGQTHSTR